MDVSTDPVGGVAALSAHVLVAGVLLAVAYWLMMRPKTMIGRLTRSTQIMKASRSVRPGATAPPDDFPTSGTTSREQRNQVACLVAGLGVWALLGGFTGLLFAAIVSVAGPFVLARLEPRSVRVRRQALEAAAPLVADLLAACLASGASTAAATLAVSEALGEPIASVLGNCVAQIRLGADPVRVWGALAGEAELAPIARSILRSADSGAPLAELLLRTGDDLRSARRARLEAAARSAGIKAVGPLGLCFLPAFMLLGVVPLVASLIGQMLAQ